MTELRKIEDAFLLARLNRPLHELHVQQHPHLFKPFDEEAIAVYFAGCLADSSYLHIGAFVADEPAGFVQAQLIEKPENPFAWGYRYVHIHQLNVLETFRGKGIAGELMNAVHLHAGDQGIAITDLTVWQFNTPARTFYERIGYEYGLLRMYRRLQDSL